MSLADRVAPLGIEDLEGLATAAYLIGHADEYVMLLERAHRASLEAGDPARAARHAFWAAFELLLRGEAGPATGWLGRARRLVKGRDCVEQGYLLLPVAERRLAEERGADAFAAAMEAASIGERFDDADLIACARHLQGRALVEQGRVEDGLALLDEAMVAVTAGELSPIVTGLIYCSVLDACRRAWALDRAREWTSALAEWCDRQPDMVAFTAACRVHRAEILRLGGDWPDAVEETVRAAEHPRPPAAAFYERAEVHRLRGEVAAAEELYVRASRAGRDPQPGLALLRLTQGRTDRAVAAIRRALAATTDPTQRLELLPACVEVLLAAGDVDAARDAGRELEAASERLRTDLLQAATAQARGAIALAAGDAEAALAGLRAAQSLWERLEVPYEAARVRVLAGLACRQLRDEEGARLELGAARAVFERLGAAPDVARVAELAPGGRPRPDRGLTPRELEVLRRVATGRTNRDIAGELGLSERTVERHLSNIFVKLDVDSRTAATAWAYEHDLL